MTSTLSLLLAPDVAITTTAGTVGNVKFGTITPPSFHWNGKEDGCPALFILIKSSPLDQTAAISQTIFSVHFCE